MVLHLERKWLDRKEFLSGKFLTGDPGEAENRADGSLWWCSEAVDRRGDLEFKTYLNRFKSV